MNTFDSFGPVILVVATFLFLIFLIGLKVSKKEKKAKK